MSRLSSPTLSRNWLDAFCIYFKKPVFVMILFGFAAGLPLLLVFSTLSAWLSDNQVSRSAIGFFAWVGMTYSIKVLWAPVIDRFRLPLLGALGQRRSWILLGQLGVGAGLVGMSFLDPQTSLFNIAICAVIVAFCSSTQDVAIDAFRIESADIEYQGAMSAAYILGYRLAMLVSGAGALFIADISSWSLSYLCMASLVLIGIGAVLWVKEPANDRDSSPEHEADMVRQVFGRDIGFAQMGRFKQHVIGAIVCPFLEFFNRNGRFAILVLLFVAVFRLSDITMGIMANPFYLDLGYSKSEIASIAKGFGFFMTIMGSALCGVLVVRLGIFRPLLIGAILVAATNVLFALMASADAPGLIWLGFVISADNLSGGIATTAFIAYLSSLTHRSYTATQYALFSSLMTLPGKFMSGFSGLVVDASGYDVFFFIAAALGIPAIFMVMIIARHDKTLASA